MESSGIELQGNLLLVYKRNVSNPVEIDNLNIVLKGLWRLTENRQEQQDFIYKKALHAGGYDNEERLLKELYCDNDINTEMISSEIGGEHKHLIDLSNHNLMLTKLFHGQGFYDGFFNYSNQQI
jgi:hypothetical protein